MATRSSDRSRARAHQLPEQGHRGFHHPPVRRHAGVQHGGGERRHRDAHYARHARRRSHLEHAEADFVVSRAVTRLGEFYPWVRGKFNKESKNALANGILYLKGGDLQQEITESGLKVQQYYLKEYFTEEFFETKQVIYVKG